MSMSKNRRTSQMKRPIPIDLFNLTLLRANSCLHSTGIRARLMGLPSFKKNYQLSQQNLKSRNTKGIVGLAAKWQQRYREIQTAQKVGSLFYGSNGNTKFPYGKCKLHMSFYICVKVRLLFQFMTINLKQGNSNLLFAETISDTILSQMIFLFCRMSANTRNTDNRLRQIYQSEQSKLQWAAIDQGSQRRYFREDGQPILTSTPRTQNVSVAYSLSGHFFVKVVWDRNGQTHQAQIRTVLRQFQGCLSS